MCYFRFPDRYPRRGSRRHFLLFYRVPHPQRGDRTDIPFGHRHRHLRSLCNLGEVSGTGMLLLRLLRALRHVRPAAILGLDPGVIQYADARVPPRDGFDPDATSIPPSLRCVGRLRIPSGPSASPCGSRGPVGSLWRGCCFLRGCPHGHCCAPGFCDGRSSFCPACCFRSGSSHFSATHGFILNATASGCFDPSGGEGWYRVTVSMDPCGVCFLGPLDILAFAHLFYMPAFLPVAVHDFYGILL